MTDERGVQARRRFGPKEIVVTVVVVLAVIFAAINTEDVTVDFAVAELTLPLIVLIAGLLVIGFGIGWFAGRRD